MSNLLDHAQRELELARADGDLASAIPIDRGILDIVRGFSEQGHSGGSASIVGPRIGWIVNQLLAFEPITPLTGAAGEWIDVTEQFGQNRLTQQNRRCGYVFRELHAEDQLGGGTWIAYALDQVIWTDRLRHSKDPAGAFTSWDSARRIEFPWTPGRPRYVWKRLRWLDRAWARLRGHLRP